MDQLPLFFVEQHKLIFGSKIITSLFLISKINIGLDMDNTSIFSLGSLPKGSYKKIEFSLYEDETMLDAVNLEVTDIIEFYLSAQGDCIEDNYKIKKDKTTGLTFTGNVISLEMNESDSENLAYMKAYNCLLKVVKASKTYKFKGTLTIV